MRRGDLDVRFWSNSCSCWPFVCIERIFHLWLIIWGCFLAQFRLILVKFRNSVQTIPESIQIALLVTSILCSTHSNRYISNTALPFPKIKLPQKWTQVQLNHIFVLADTFLSDLLLCLEFASVSSRPFHDSNIVQSKKYIFVADSSPC